LAVRAKTENIRVWFDPEGDLLEVLFEDRVGYFKETADDRVMVRVDMADNIIGFQILGASTFAQPLNLSLRPVEDLEPD
jgi:uncharacterized protein YuzE